MYTILQTAALQRYQLFHKLYAILTSLHNLVNVKMSSSFNIFTDVEPPTVQTCSKTLLFGTDVASDKATVTWTSPSVSDNSNEPIQVFQVGIVGFLNLKHILLTIC